VKAAWEASVTSEHDAPRPDRVAEVVAAMQRRLDRLPAADVSRREFLQTYQRTTAAVGATIAAGSFEDPDWVERWDVAFAGFYLAALDADLDGSGTVPRPWRLAFDAPATAAPVQHVLLGINAHVNYDLPQALLAVIPDVDFADGPQLDRRRRDHERIDGVLAERVRAEDGELAQRVPRTLLDRALGPLNRWASRRFLREARQRVWHNTIELQRARVAGPDRYAARLAELERLSAARIADLLAPGPVLLRLAVHGFGVVLPPSTLSDGAGVWYIDDHG
jgi:Family of unknown function (DUF5995)